MFTLSSGEQSLTDYGKKAARHTKEKPPQVNGPCGGFLPRD